MTLALGGGHRERPDRDQNRTIIDRTQLAVSARTVWDLFPVIRGAAMVRAWAGIEARMPDNTPVIGPSSAADGVYHQFGFSAHGFQLGPAVRRIRDDDGSVQPPEALSVDRHAPIGPATAAARR
jgi:sarcosine oxidase, subunit beta